jgi:hypothetical protein
MIQRQDFGQKWIERLALLTLVSRFTERFDKLIAQKYDGSSFRTPGRRRTRDEVAAMVVRMAEENRGWGIFSIGVFERRTGILGPYYEIEQQTTHALYTIVRIPRSSYTLDIADHSHAWGFMADRIINAPWPP